MSNYYDKYLKYKTKYLELKYNAEGGRFKNPFSYLDDLKNILDGNPPKKPVENTPKNPVENPPKNPVENTPKNPVENPPKNPVENPPKNPVENPPKNPVENTPKNPVENPPKKPENKIESKDWGMQEDYSKEYAEYPKYMLYESVEHKSNQHLISEYYTQNIVSVDGENLVIFKKKSLDDFNTIKKKNQVPVQQNLNNIMFDTEYNKLSPKDKEQYVIGEEVYNNFGHHVYTNYYKKGTKEYNEYINKITVKQNLNNIIYDTDYNNLSPTNKEKYVMGEKVYTNFGHYLRTNYYKKGTKEYDEYINPKKTNLTPQYNNRINNYLYNKLTPDEKKKYNGPYNEKVQVGSSDEIRQFYYLK
jgi:hypothetical protein